MENFGVVSAGINMQSVDCFYCVFFFICSKKSVTPKNKIK